MSDGSPGGPAARAAGGTRAGRPDVRGLEAFVRAALGSSDPEVEAAGPEDEIAVLRVPPSLVPRVVEAETRRAVAREARRLGFRHSALDLSSLEGGRPSGSGTAGAEA